MLKSPFGSFKVQFFTWDAQHPDMSWWEHLAKEAPHLAALGFTQIWLPPPNKATRQVRVSGFNDMFTTLNRVKLLQMGQGYDAYDLVRCLVCSDYPPYR